MLNEPPRYIGLVVLLCFFAAAAGWFLPIPADKGPKPVVARTATTVDKVRPLEKRIAALEAQLQLYQSRPAGLSGAEVRALVDQLLPGANPCPPNSDPQCQDSATTTSVARPVPAPPAPPTTVKRKKPRN